jgi:sugar phosphate isomerase/epimerase
VFVPSFGICTSIDDAAAIHAAGGEFIEELVHALLQGEVPDGQWRGAQRVAESALPVPAANQLVPASLKITGPEADRSKLRAYMERITRRSGQVGIRTLVFGSAGARNVPEGFDRGRAREQVLDFIRDSAELCREHEIILVAEHMHRGECNIINSLDEAMDYVREINHPNFQCLLDSYHFWKEDEPLESLRKAMPWIRHVHVADKEGRLPPGESGGSDYRPLFRELKRFGYDGPITVEAIGYKDIVPVAERVLRFLREQWKEA